MSILIKGMEMPTTCGKCKIKNAIECNRWNLVRSVTLDRHRDCPLVPVPPHGRLIDADALTAKFKEMGLGEHSLIERLFADGVYVMIDYAPTIIPASEEGE